MTRFFSLLTLTCLLFSPAFAKVRVSDALLQRGTYIESEGECAGITDAQTAEEKGCLCTADVIYPKVTSGISMPTAQSRVNTSLRLLAPNQICEGERIEISAQNSALQRSSSYEVLLNDESFLSVVQENCFGNTCVRKAVSFAMPQATLLRLGDLIARDQLSDLNDYIYNYVLEQVYDNDLESAGTWAYRLDSQRDSFITDNQCNGCIFYLLPEGAYIEFQQHAVAELSAGRIEVPLPIHFLKNETLKSYFKEQADAER